MAVPSFNATRLTPAGMRDMDGMDGTVFGRGDQTTTGLIVRSGRCCVTGVPCIPSTEPVMCPQVASSPGPTVSFSEGEGA